MIQRNHYLARKASRLLAMLRGVDTVTVKVVTGSIVTHYNPRVIQSREIIDTLTRAGYFDPSKAITHDDYLRAACVKTGEVAWKAFFGAFMDVAMEGSALSLITILL